jgi:uncharacterized membrane protein (UPF0127 family)
VAGIVGYVELGDTAICIERADTEAARELGLSGRASLSPGSGMLFVFDGEEERGFWMKDMRFSIDIIWADTKGRVVTIAADVSPDSYPQTFYPTSPAHYALEVPAGFAKAHAIAIGTKIVVK